MPITITATANGSLTPTLGAAGTSVANGDFLITGSDGPLAGATGDGIDEGTRWTFDFNSDPNLASFDPVRGLTSALLTLSLTPGGPGISTDQVFIEGMPPIDTPIIQGLPVGAAAAVNVRLLDFYNPSNILSHLITGNNTVSMIYADDAIVSQARLVLTQYDPGFLYPIKFVCGDGDHEILSRGRYFTAINVHNPNNVLVRLRYKAAIALPGQAGPISRFEETRLSPDAAFEIDCRQVRQLIGDDQPFVKGFVVIESEHELDVVAVYTAGAPEVATLHTERVAPRRGAREPSAIPADVPLGTAPSPE